MLAEENISFQEYSRRFRENPGQRDRSETWWVNHQPWLEQSGYAPRPRYRQDWEPSWKATKQRSYKDFEDGQRISNSAVIDAMRLKDDSTVTLKPHKPHFGHSEVEIGQLFSTEPLASDPHNHCVPFIDVLPVPDAEDNERLIATPFLRPWDSPRLDTYGEAVAFLSQIFEGIQFMHQHHVAHRDCTANNIMMDAASMYPQGFHPVKINRRRDWKGKAKYFTRTQTAPKYYLIDFGHSRRYDPKEGPELVEASFAHSWKERFFRTHFLQVLALFF